MGMIIRVYSHNFVVSTTERRFKWILAAFIRNRLTVDKFQMGKMKGKGKDKGIVFAAANQARTQVFLPIKLFDEFKLNLLTQGVRENEYEVSYHKPKKGAKVEMNFIAKFKMSELQERCLNFIREPFVRRVAPLQTGKGKTALALYYMCELGERTLITMNAKYIPRWVMDLAGEEAKVDLLPEDLIIVHGVKELKKYIRQVRSDELEFKVMLVSNTTLQLFYEDVFANPQDWKKLGIKQPSDLFLVLKIGFRIRDEAHEHLHFNFKFDLFTHVRKTLDLSATLIYDDQGMERMSKIVYPIEDRFDQGKWDTYIEVYSVEYRLKPTTKLKWTQGWQGPYNHNQLEASILANNVYLSDYKTIVLKLVESLFIEPVLAEGKREVCLIYASTKEMCTKLQGFLQSTFNELDVNRKIGEDDYDELLTADIIVSTPKSAGTGVDIPRLGVIINTVNISSTQAVVQMAGRLRPADDIVSKFYYLTCLDIPQHVKYHNEKRTKLKGVVKSLSVIDTTYRL